jgi:GntR family transcriptional regulator
VCLCAQNKESIGGTVLIQPDYRDAMPICEQIKERIRKMVITHAIQKDERLPEIREMSSRLAVNPNTIARAYRELEEEGYLSRREGSGIYVTDAWKTGEYRRGELLREFDRIVIQLSALSVGTEELKQRVAEVAEGEEGFDRG